MYTPTDEYYVRTKDKMTIEMCDHCMKPINVRRDGYYSGVRDDKHYYVHAACFKDWMSRSGEK